MLNASFVRTAGERDRIYVTRADGSEMSWVFATYGDVPPHDMIHLIVESAFDITHGFWGRVDAGVDPGAITAAANRIGGRNKYAAFGDDLSGLALAEVLANSGWLTNDDSADAMHRTIALTCREARVDPPRLLSIERTAKVREVLKHLAARWKGLYPKGAIQLAFDSSNPAQGFERLAASIT